MKKKEYIKIIEDLKDEIYNFIHENTKCLIQKGLYEEQLDATRKRVTELEFNTIAFASQLQAWGFYDVAEQLKKEILRGPVEAPDYYALRARFEEQTARTKHAETQLHNVLDIIRHTGFKIETRDDGKNVLRGHGVEHVEVIPDDELFENLLGDKKDGEK